MLVSIYIFRLLYYLCFCYYTYISLVQKVESNIDNRDSNMRQNILGKRSINQLIFDDDPGGDNEDYEWLPD